LFETRNNFSRLCQLLLVVGVAVLIFPQPASGRKRARPKDYRLILKDQRFELVMLSPHRSAIRDPALRKQYACSGMYVRGRGGPRLLYAVDWFRDPHNLFVSSDGEAIASAEWHSIGFKGQTKVVICYRMGKVVQEYSEADFKKAKEALDQAKKDQEASKKRLAELQKKRDELDGKVQPEEKAAKPDDKV